MNKKAVGSWMLAMTLFLAMSSNVMAQTPATGKYKEGIHYTAIENAPLPSGDKVEVIEAFSYLCSHCATFEPYISNWLKRKPENVNFKRIPVVFGRSSWELYAQAYVTAELMGIADAAHGALMEKLWKEKEMLRTLDELGQFYANFGVNQEKFVATSKSFAVNAKLRKEQREIQSAGVRGTPSMIVNGKYLVSANEAIGSYDVLLDVIDYLVSLEAAAHNAAVAPQNPSAQESAEAVAESQ